MYRETQDHQMSLNDRYLTAGSQTRSAVEKSRAWLVGQVIYPNVGKSRFAALFSDDKGSRPNIPVRIYFCALILKRMYGLSDEVLIEMIRCGALQFQYALHTTDADSQPLSLVSLSRFRRKVAEYDEANGCDLVKDEYVRISKKIAEAMPLLPKAISEVAVALKRSYKEKIFYFKSEKAGLDIDFYVPERATAIQVAYSISDTAYDREVNNLIRLAGSFPEAKRFVIVTADEDKLIRENGVGIEVLPLYRFLLEL